MAELDIRFELNPAKIFQNCPEDPGVYTIEDREGAVLFIAHGRNITQSVTRHLPENELRNEVVRSRGKYFRFFLTEDETEAARVFDAYVARHKRFPDGMEKAPAGSTWEGKPDPGAQKQPAPPEPLEPESSPGPSPDASAAAPRPAPGQEPKAAASTPVPASREAGRPLNVVLLDDEVQLLVLMKEFLEMEGHRVHAAANRKMLAKALKVQPLDVLILDYHLPELSAETVIQAARQLNPKVLILMITGTQHKERAYELLEQGVRKIFPKPFSMKMLARSITDHLGAGDAPSAASSTPGTS